jgi:RNA polymerase sigma-70 factor (ECF subfamily)
MATSVPSGITALLGEWRQGNESALDKLIPLVYPKLRQLAHRYMRGERRDHTLETAGLVHEAFVRLVDSKRVQWRDRAHFFALSAQLMRRILVDWARSHGCRKRGGGTGRTPLDDALDLCQERARDLVALDDALDGLAATDPGKARIVELRFFGGLEMEEIAEVLGVSADAVRWKWRLARAWLLRELSKGVRHGG